MFLFLYLESQDSTFEDQVKELVCVLHIDYKWDTNSFKYCHLN